MFLHILVFFLTMIFAKGLLAWKKAILKNTCTINVVAF